MEGGMQGNNVQPMPAEHAFSKVEDRTTTRAVGRRPYSPHILFRIFTPTQSILINCPRLSCMANWMRSRMA